jgi:hypothetical protein
VADRIPLASLCVHRSDDGDRVNLTFDRDDVPAPRAALGQLSLCPDAAADLGVALIQAAADEIQVGSSWGFTLAPGRHHAVLNPPTPPAAVVREHELAALARELQEAKAAWDDPKTPQNGALRRFAEANLRLYHALRETFQKPEEA